MGLAGDEVEGARRGRAEDRSPAVVAHRVVLRVVPQPGDRVAVVVVHDEAGTRVGDAGRRGVGVAVRRLGELDELVHRAAVEGFLLRDVVVVLRAGLGLRRRQPRRLILVGIRGQQRRVARVVVRHGRSCGSGEGGAVGVRGVRIGAEVVVEGDVLVEQHHDMFDRRRGLGRVVHLGHGRRDGGRDPQRGDAGERQHSYRGVPGPEPVEFGAWHFLLTFEWLLHGERRSHISRPRPSQSSLSRTPGSA